MVSLDMQRLEKERQFHNNRFGGEERLAQSKYYFAVKDGALAYKNLVHDLSPGKRILEYGCGVDSLSFFLAPLACHVTAIDISDVAIFQSKKKALDENIGNINFCVMNAESLEFNDEAFDLIFGSGILHHLSLEKAYSEIARCLKPGGTAVFWEPLGHNFLINLYRYVTPRARTEDEHPLHIKDIVLAENYFDCVKTTWYGLTTLFSVPFRNTRFGLDIFDIGRRLDIWLLRSPRLARNAWYSLILLSK